MATVTLVVKKKQQNDRLEQETEHNLQHTCNPQQTVSQFV